LRVLAVGCRNSSIGLGSSHASQSASVMGHPPSPQRNREGGTWQSLFAVGYIRNAPACWPSHPPDLGKLVAGDSAEWWDSRVAAGCAGISGCKPDKHWFGGKRKRAFGFYMGVGYWSGFTKDRGWQERARRIFEDHGWTDIHFWNGYSEGFVPWSSSVDADEIQFIVSAERLDREAVQWVLEQVGIQHTAYISIEECQSE
jgi:hypothetical protein